MIRLQCPACQTIVKIGADTFAKHPVVRCANCHGLVPVQQCIVSKKSVPKRRATMRRPTSPSQMPLIASVIVGLLLLTGAGFAIYWFGFRSTPAAQIAKVKHENFDSLSIDELHDQSFLMMEALLDVFDAVQSQADAEAALLKINDIKEAFYRISQKLSEKISKLSPEEYQHHMQQVNLRALPRLRAMEQRYRSILGKILNYPKLHQSLTTFNPSNPTRPRQ